MVTFRWFIKIGWELFLKNWSQLNHLSLNAAYLELIVSPIKVLPYLKILLESMLKFSLRKNWFLKEKKTLTIELSLAKKDNV